MFNLQIYQIATKTVRPIMTSSVHRWSIFSGSKYLNCEERISRCHSMNFEDYSADKNYLQAKKTRKVKDQKIRSDQIRLCDLFNDEDPTLHMLVYG
jgi:hypothetical protein